MAAPSISTYILSSSSHYYGSEGGAAVMTSPSDSVTKVSAIISQTSGGAAIETVDTTVKTSSDLYADRWALSWHTAGITASPYYVRMWATNSDGDGTVREVAPYIYFPPAVSVTSPVDGSTLTDSSVTMAWTAADDYGISYQRASVSHDGTELWGAEVEGNSIAVPSSVVFENGESYSFSVTARNGKGMESTATNTASFSFVAPSVPALVIAEGDGKSASITVTDSSYTESGTVLEASSAMMDSLTIQGQSVQDGTPTPSAPVAIESVAPRSGQPSIYICAGDPDGVYTTTPIPVTLRSLPDGTHDEWISGETADTLVQRVGMFIADSSTPYVASVALNGDSTTMRANFRVPDFDGIASNNVVSDLFKRDAGHQSAWGNVSFGEVFSTSAGFFFGLPTTVTDASSANAWFASNPTTILYPLATPVTTTLAHVNLPYVDGSAWVDAEVTPQIEATFRPVDFPDQPAADSVDVVRVNADGTSWTVASGLSVGDTVTDPLPPLGVDAVYKAVGKTSAGGMSEKLYMHEIPTTGWVLNFGDAAQETVEFIYNPQATMTLAQGGESYHFADGGMGGGFPVFYPTTDRDASGTLAFDTVLYGDSDRLLDLCRRYPVAWLRDPFGHRWRAHVRPSVSHGVGQVWPVTIAWDAVRFEEV